MSMRFSCLSFLLALGLVFACDHESDDVSVAQAVDASDVASGSIQLRSGVILNAGSDDEPAGPNSAAVGEVVGPAEAELVTWIDAWEASADSGPTVTMLRCELQTLQCLIGDDTAGHRRVDSANLGTICAKEMARPCSDGQRSRYDNGKFDACLDRLPQCLDTYVDPVGCSAVFAYCFGAGQGQFVELR